MNELICQKCHGQIHAEDFFCSHCGIKLKEPLVPTTIGKQLMIYLVSFFLPPFGLGFTFSYLRQKETKAQLIGWVSLILTILSIVITILTVKYLMDQYATILNGTVKGDPKVLRELQQLQ